MSISDHPPTQLGLFSEVAVPRGPPPEHLRVTLAGILNVWSLMVGTRHDATPYYREQTAALLQAAHEALDEGASPYTTLLLVVAPAFQQADESPLEVVEVDT